MVSLMIRDGVSHVWDVFYPAPLPAKVMPPLFSLFAGCVRSTHLNPGVQPQPQMRYIPMMEPLENDSWETATPGRTWEKPDTQLQETCGFMDKQKKKISSCIQI